MRATQKIMDLNDILRAAVEAQASDIHLKVGAIPHLRVGGQLEPMEGVSRLAEDGPRSLIKELLNDDQLAALAKKSEVDHSFGASGLGRFRVTVFHQRGSLSLVIRVIPDNVVTVAELKLPAVVQEISEQTRGMILVTGASGTGKSTTLAAMIHHINSHRRCHIVTIEDPVEFLIRDQLALISQREVTVDTQNFARALRAALRQDPDVIMVGEMRDLETVQTALQAAETGHLLMSTLHTTNSTQTIQRIISMFPPGEQKEIRLRLASSLTAVISLRLLSSSATGGRVPAVEVLRNTELVRSLIEQPERTREIRAAMETGSSQYGMQTFDQSIHQLHEEGLVTLEEALRHASSPEDLKLRIQGIMTSQDSM